MVTMIREFRVHGCDLADLFVMNNLNGPSLDRRICNEGNEIKVWAESKQCVIGSCSVSAHVVDLLLEFTSYRSISPQRCWSSDILYKMISSKMTVCRFVYSKMVNRIEWILHLRRQVTKEKNKETQKLLRCLKSLCTEITIRKEKRIIWERENDCSLCATYDTIIAIDKTFLDVAS